MMLRSPGEMLPMRRSVLSSVIKITPEHSTAIATPAAEDGGAAKHDSGDRRQDELVPHAEEAGRRKSCEQHAGQGGSHAAQCVGDDRHRVVVDFREEADPRILADAEQFPAAAVVATPITTSRSTPPESAS